MAEELMLKENENMIIKTKANEGTLVPKADEVVKMIMLKKKELSNLEKKMKEIILEQMEANGIVKVITDNVSISYVEAKTDQEVFHADKLRAEQPDIYDEYVTLDGTKSAYITIRTK